MALGGINPAIGAQAGRMVPGSGNNLNPFETIRTIADTQRLNIANTQHQQELEARNAAGQIMSLYPTVQEGFEAIQRNPALAPYIPQIYQSFAETGRIQAETQRSVTLTGQTEQQVANTALEAFYKGLTTLDGNQTPAYNRAQFNNFARIGRGTLSNTNEIRAYDNAVNSARTYLDSTGWTGDPLTKTVYATLLPHTDAAVSTSYRAGLYTQPQNVPISPPVGGNPPPGTPANPNIPQTLPPRTDVPAASPSAQPQPAPQPTTVPAAQTAPAPPAQPAVAGGGEPQPTLIPGGAMQVQQPPVAAGTLDPARGGTSFLGTPLAPNYGNLPNRMQPISGVSVNAGGDFVGSPYGELASTAQKDYATSGAAQYSQALAGEQALAGIANTFNTMQQGGAWTQPGFLSGVRNTINSALHTIGNIAGYKGELPDLAPTASASDVANQGRNFAANLVRTLLPGQVHAAQTFADAVSVVPGTEDTWLGGMTVLASLDAQIHRVADFRNFQMEWMADQRSAGVQHPNLINSVEAFNQQFPPAQYQQKALSNIGMNANMTINDIFKWENSGALKPEQGNAIINNNFDLSTGRLKPNSVWGRMFGAPGSQPQGQQGTGQ